MFSDTKKNKSTRTDHSKEQNKIAQGTRIIGEIIAKGGLRIEGTLEGSLKTPGKVVLGKTGVISGSMECENADFEGEFSGDLLVSETLTLRSTATIDGEVSAGKLAIEPGAIFNASCVMKGAVKTLKDDRKKPTEKKEGAKRTAIGS